MIISKDMAILLSSIITAPVIDTTLFKSRHLFLRGTDSRVVWCGDRISMCYLHTTYFQIRVQKPWPELASLCPPKGYYNAVLPTMPCWSLPPVCGGQWSGTQGPQKTPDAEDRDYEGPDESDLPLIQGEAIPLHTCGIHQLLNELQTPGVCDLMHSNESVSFNNLPISVLSFPTSFCNQLEIVLRCSD